MAWVSARGKHLKEGMVLRVPLSDTDLSRGYLYAICSGSGFGCDPGALGNAIFVDHEAHTLDETMAGQGKDVRWERYWKGIEILEGD